jgi:GntR family transcriptional regulator
MTKIVRPKFIPDPADSTPLYLQLARHFEDAIRDGRYRAHAALLSERTLSESLGLSRVTARKAIDQLVAQGLVVRRQGSGNYVAPRLEQGLTHLTSFSEELHRRGFKPGSIWLSRTIKAASREERRILRLAPDERVARLKRLRLADGVVMAQEEASLPESVLPDPAAVGSSLYAHLARIGKAPVRAVQHIHAVNAPTRLAAKMGIPAGKAVLFITRIAYLKSGKAVEVTYSHCRSDYYDFVAEMRRAP